MDIFHKTLRHYWGYDKFRPLQEEIIKSVHNRKDTLGLMPTGGGKSLTFQVPAMVMDGLCLVVTPLIALMRDQVDNLRRRGIKALAVYSGMTRQEIIVAFENAILGDYKFLYISPERLSTDLFLTKLRDMNICLLVVDESHCISQWGYDFRPSYMRIAEIRKYLTGVPVLALTATATKDVVNDIQRSLSFSENNVFKKSFERSNLSYIVIDTSDKTGELVRILNKIQGSSIVYVRSRLRAKEIATELQRIGLSADFYHAGLSTEEKNRKQEEWKNDKCRIIVSTNAFGMGIDKPDVRLVVHMDLPNSLEEYYQEAGRVGRDGNKAYAVLLYNKSDTSKLKKRISDEYPDKDFIKNVYEQLAYFLQVAEGFGTDMAYDFNLMHFCSVYKLPAIQTHNALKILDLAGYIEYSEEADNRSRLIFTVYRDELYKYGFEKCQELLISQILRQYTGLFADYVTIDETFLAVKSGIKRQDVYEMLSALSKRGIIDYIPHKKTPFIIYSQTRVDIKYLSIPKNVYEERKTRFETRIKGITEYAEKKDICRSRMLLNYFGETDSYNCGSCDVCRSKNKKPIENSDFNKLASLIENFLKDEDRYIYQITEYFAEFEKEDILKTLQFMVEKGFIEINIQKISLKK